MYIYIRYSVYTVTITRLFDNRYKWLQPNNNHSINRYSVT